MLCFNQSDFFLLVMLGNVLYPESNQDLQKWTNLSVDRGFSAAAVGDVGFIFLKTRFHVRVDECGGNNKEGKSIYGCAFFSSIGGCVGVKLPKFFD